MRKLIQAILDIFNNIRYRQKLFISYLVVIIIPIAVLGFYSYGQSRSNVLNETKRGLSESTRQIADTMNYKLKNYNNVIQFLVNNEQIVQIINNEDSSYFDKYLNYVGVLDPLISNVLNLNYDMKKTVIYTDNKNITERFDSIQSLERIRHENWFKESMLDKQVHWIVRDHALIGLSRFAEPFRKAPLNLLYVEIKYDSVFNIMLPDSVSFSAAVSDKDGQILFSTNSPQTKAAKDIESSLLQVPAGEKTFAGVKYLSIKSEIPETGWTLTYYGPLKSIEVNANHIVGATIIIILSCLFILLLLTWVFSSTFVKRIDLLNRKMKIVQDGNLNIIVSSQSKDEIGELTNRFGVMLNNVNILIADVYHSKIVQKEAELKALQAQINPHFLYNTLSLINWKAIQAGVMDISHITNNISKFYRTVLNRGKSTISVTDEIANTRCYLEIQLVMHDGSFDVEYVLDEEIFRYNMINLVLQPIIENAIEHGIDQLKGTRGKLTITGSVLEESISFIVEDNGPGLDLATFENIMLHNTKGYGLKNVHDRLRIAFGDNYGISLLDESAAGTRIAVNIPKQQ